jgi:Putative nuclear localisation signal of quaking
LPRQIFQVAFVVPDLERAIRQYARELRLGGWVILENMVYAQFKYRGADSKNENERRAGQLRHHDLRAHPADRIVSGSTPSRAVPAG